MRRPSKGAMMLSTHREERLDLVKHALDTIKVPVSIW